VADVSDDDPREFTVVATKTVTATFSVYADDEDDARFQVENASGSDYAVDCSDALKFTQEDWDASDVTEKP
jgi:hypothetical protein